MSKKPKTFIAENKDRKIVGSPYYNYAFDKNSGFFVRWGKDKDDDPLMSPLGPEIADIEISTVCHGIGKTTDTRNPCPWCYKSNTGCGQNMSLDTYKNVFKLLKPENNSPLTQIAFGIGDIDGNPDLWKIMEHTRENGIIPNITINGMGLDERSAQKLANICGAVSVSRYHIPDVAYNAIKLLTDAGLKQVNIHQLLSEETYDGCFNLLEDLKTDKRLEKLNAVVLLMLKPKGNRNKLHNIANLENFFRLAMSYQEAGIQLGMDSCTAPLMLKFAEKHDQNEIIQSIEPCESTLFSVYINVEAQMFPCSFTEGTPGWEQGINLLEADDFLKDVWFNSRTKEWRQSLLESSKGCDCSVKKYCRSCPVYNITSCKGV
jgi:MoaA/NifB/PqqE/SkfB family radical SAM enzyme